MRAKVAAIASLALTLLCLQAIDTHMRSGLWMRVNFEVSVLPLKPVDGGAANYDTANATAVRRDKALADS